MEAFQAARVACAPSRWYFLTFMRTPLRRKPVEIELPAFGISAFTSRHAPSFTMPFMADRYHKLCLVESGEGILRLEKGEEPLRPATLVHLPPGVPHQFSDNPKRPMVLNALCFSSEALIGLRCVRETWRQLQELLPPASPRPVAYENDRLELQRLFRKIVFEMGQELAGRPASVVALSTMMLVLVVRCLSRDIDLKSSATPKRFATSLAVIDDRFTEDLRVDDLAKVAGMSYRAYTERFRKHTGMTAMQYVTQRRLEFAKRRMLETEDILGSSLEAGFRDLSHFYRVFKRHSGETPQGFIDRHLLQDQSNE